MGGEGFGNSKTEKLEMFLRCIHLNVRILYRVVTYDSLFFPQIHKSQQRQWHVDPSIGAGLGQNDQLITKLNLQGGYELLCLLFPLLKLNIGFTGKCIYNVYVL